MSKSYGNWAYNPKKGIVFKCGWGCRKKHEHYSGDYEKALKYFTGGLESREEERYGDLMNVIIYYQMDEKTITRTSAELYDILLDLSKTKKYWIPPGQRHKEIINILKEADEKHLIFDDEIIKELSKSDLKRSQQRVYKYQKWLENNKFQ